MELEAHNQKDCIEGRVGVDLLVNGDTSCAQPQLSVRDAVTGRVISSSESSD